MTLYISPPNTKLGFRSFSLPPIESCPGRSPECSALCYSSESFARSPNVSLRRMENMLQLMMLEETGKWGLLITWLVEELKNGGDTRFRFHVDGDFFCVNYIQAVHEVTRQLPDVQFLVYTRCWTRPEMLPALESLRLEPNVFLYASIDKTMWQKPPKNWSLAAMEDDPRGNVPRAVICPHDAGVTGRNGKKIQCKECGLCFRPNATVRWPILRTKDQSGKNRAA